MEKIKKCNNCGGEFPENSDFFYRGNNGKGFHPACKKCEKEKAKQWRINNPERFREHVRKSNLRESMKEYHRRDGKRRREEGFQLEWQRKNKDKTKTYRDNRRSKIHLINNFEWESCKKYFEFKCCYCGIIIEENYKLYNQDFHKDHYYSDGANDLSNCVPACKSCNSEKHTKDGQDWYDSSNKKFSLKRQKKILKWLESDYKNFINE